MADNLDDIAAAVHARPSMVDPDTAVAYPHAIGKLEVERLGEYPRFVWVSEGGSIDAVDDVGGGVVGATRTRSVRTDAMAVQWHIWGEDREAARDLMHLLIYACWEQSYGSVQFGDYDFVTERDPKGEFATHGSKILLEGVFRVPVSEAADPLTTIAHEGHTGTFVSDLDGSEEVTCTP